MGQLITKSSLVFKSRRHIAARPLCVARSEVRALLRRRHRDLRFGERLLRRILSSGSVRRTALMSRLFRLARHERRPGIAARGPAVARIQWQPFFILPD